MLGPGLCDHISVAPLLPKLRGYFAEFLSSASPAGLRILSPSTCVGLRYGTMTGYSGFSWQAFRALRYSFSLLHGLPLTHTGLSCIQGLPLRRASHPRLAPCACVPAVLLPWCAGFFTCCPSGTPLGLPLGPDFPRADQLYPGILGYSAWRIPTSISLLIPAFSLPDAPLPLPVQLRCIRDAPLPCRFPCIRGFGGVFQPRAFSAQGPSASELLRTLLTYGCF